MVHLRIKYMLYLVVPVTLLNKTTHPNTKIKHKDVIKVDQAKIKLYVVSIITLIPSSVVRKRLIFNLNLFGRHVCDKSLI